MLTKIKDVLLIIAALSVVLWVATGTSAQSLAGETTAQDLSSAALATTAPLLQYQGRMVDPSTGEPVDDGFYTMTFNIYDVATGGSALWTETKSVEILGGLFNTVLGDTSTLTQSVFDGRELWLGIKVGADAEATPRQQFLPVAYALSLVPGATIDGDLTINGSLNGGSHNHNSNYYTESESDSRFVNTTGPESISGSSSSHILQVTQNGTGYGIRGDSTGSRAGVLGYNSSGTGYGVYGYSTNNSGVYGYSTNSYGGYFYSGGGTSLYVSGDALVTGNLIVSGSVNGPNGTGLPIAFGVVNTNGTLANGTSNVSSTWNSASLRYEITISGHSYFWTDYVTTVTAFSGCSYSNSIRTSSVSGKLLVYIYNSSGSKVQCNFQFATQKS